MAFQHGQPALRLHVPDLDAPIRTARGEQFAVRMPGARSVIGANRQGGLFGAVVRFVNRDSVRPEVTHREPAARRIKVHPVRPSSRRPPANRFAGAQIETRNPSFLCDRQLPAVRTENQRGTFFRRAFENRFATLPLPDKQLAALTEVGQEAAIRAERRTVRNSDGAGFQTLKLVVVRDGADTDRPVRTDAGIALVRSIESKAFGFRSRPGRTPLNVRNRHGGDGIVSQFRVWPYAGGFCQRGQAFNALTHLPAVATRLCLALEGNEELFPRRCQGGAPLLERLVLLVSFRPDARIARHQGDHRCQQRHKNRGCREQDSPVSSRQFLEPIHRAGWTGDDRFVVEVALNVHRETVGRFVTARAVLLQALHDDAVEIAARGAGQFGDTRPPFPAQRGGLRQPQCVQPGGRPWWFVVANDAPHLVQPGAQQLCAVERRAAREQFVEQHAEAVNVAARVHVHTAHLRLLGTDVSGRAEERVKLGEERLVGEPLARGLGNAEVNHLGHGRTVVDRDENVRGLEVAMDDALLVRVLNGLAHLHKQPQPRLGREPRLIAKLRDAHAAHQFHHKVKPPGLCCAAVEHLGDVRMIHQRQRLSLRLEPCDDRLGIHAELDDLERNAAANRFELFGHVNDAAPALANLFQ